MKNRTWNFFLVLSLLTMFSITFSIEVQDEPFEGQDYTGDFLIGEMDEQYPEDQHYLQESEDISIPAQKPKEEPENLDTFEEKSTDEDRQEQRMQEEEIFE